MAVHQVLVFLLFAMTGASRLVERLRKQYDPHPGFPPIPFPSLDNLCVGREGVVIFLPWDCTGYVTCYNDAASWISCPLDTRSVAIMREPICVMDEAKCQTKQSARWSKFCAQTGRGLYPSHSNCAGYYDCSVGQEGVERQCPYPELFNPTTLRCEDFRSSEAHCGKKYIPKAPCEYVENQVCTSAICLPCEERWPSCVGLADGFREIRSGYSWYLKCERERSIDVLKCPDGQVFSSNSGCTSGAVA